VAAASSALFCWFCGLNDHSGKFASGKSLSRLWQLLMKKHICKLWNPALFVNAKDTTVYVYGAYVMPNIWMFPLTSATAFNAAQRGGSEDLFSGGVFKKFLVKQLHSFSSFILA